MEEGVGEGGDRTVVDMEEGEGGDMEEGEGGTSYWS